MATGSRIFDFVFYATNFAAYQYFSYIYTDIGRTRSDWFSSSASRLIAPPFFNTSFFISGERKSRQVSKQRNPYFRRTQQPAGGSPFFRHLFTLIFIRLRFSPGTDAGILGRFRPFDPLTANTDYPCGCLNLY